ncbi:hypothetical protein Intca_1486 [Intrasporangium calvum DSM 43043]|uniref:Uncharacterized protein n=1 Tax=Intrasporangium calvum (strain ATCC 23552 / DSM 43043 / JCM 3097 / NBRC 12989 / NCIMB 10167 / NRRL B-3866 / 7 KIP) TaxID=710696 RepID=E6S7U4_INTC7|nr:hypothetical protein Intca_1486 [Intrasporangium calvum DSM 43043]
MSRPADHGRRVDRDRTATRLSTEMGWAWWLGLVLVPLLLSVLGRGASGGVPSVFFWAVAAYVAGSLVAFPAADRVGVREPVRRAVPGPAWRAVPPAAAVPGEASPCDPSAPSLPGDSPAATTPVTGLS